MIETLTLIVLFLTFLAICWYSYETRLLRLWQTRQALLSVVETQINYVISRAASPEVFMPPWIEAQRAILDGKRMDLKGLL